MDMRTVYEQLTNLNIEQQKYLWDERGKGYYGEYLLFCNLYDNIAGHGKILMNLNVPTAKGDTTEIDLVLIHETGLYVFEVKHYKGTIYGRETDDYWTQYFRTAQNQTFKNPIHQNNYHITALKNIYSNIPIYSFVVFTNQDCALRIERPQNAIVCRFSDMNSIFSRMSARKEKILNMEDIDKIFVQLSAYSQMRDEIKIDETEASFVSWLQPMIEKLEKTIYNVEKLRKKRIGATIFTVVAGVAFNLVIAILCTIIATMSAGMVIEAKNNEVEKAQAELNAFKRNFLHVDEIDSEYITQLNSYVDVTNVSLTPTAEKNISFTARISMTNDVYGVLLTEESKYIVMTDDGKVYEYNVFGEHLRYSRISNMIGSGIREYGDLAKAQFVGIQDVNEISYIKITNIELFKLDARKTTVKDGLEIELYSK